MITIYSLLAAIIIHSIAKFNNKGYTMRNSVYQTLFLMMQVKLTDSTEDHHPKKEQNTKGIHFHL